MSLEHLSDLFLHELKDVYNAEKQLTKALLRWRRPPATPS